MWSVKILLNSCFLLYNNALFQNGIISNKEENKAMINEFATWIDVTHQAKI